MVPYQLVGMTANLPFAGSGCVEATLSFVRPPERPEPDSDRDKRTLGLGRTRGEGMPDVDHVLPALERDVDTGPFGQRCETPSVVQQDLRASCLNEDGWQSRQIGVDRRCKRRGRTRSRRGKRVPSSRGANG